MPCNSTVFAGNYELWGIRLLLLGGTVFDLMMIITRGLVARNSAQVVVPTVPQIDRQAGSDASG